MNYYGQLFIALIIVNDIIYLSKINIQRAVISVYRTNTTQTYL